MEESKKCIYCKENMVYGQHTQVMWDDITKCGKRISKSVTFVMYGWRCPMKDDNCDIVLDEKDYDKNKLCRKDAYEKLKKILTDSSTE